MNEKLLQQAMALFDTQDKWDAFLELCYTRDTICEKWRSALMEKLKQRFYSSPNMDKWQIRNDKWTLQVFPRQLLENQMDLRVNLWDMRGYLYINKDIYNSYKVREMIQNNPDIISLLDGFEYYNEWDIYNKPFANNICEPSRDSSHYIWGHDTERVADVISETYLYPFMTDEIADFFVRVCNEAKKGE